MDMIRATRLTYLPAACGLLALLATAGCDRARDADAAVVEKPPAAPVDGVPAPEPRWVAAASGEPIARTLSLPSHLMVERNVGVTVRRDGIIEEIRADRGDRVAQDQVLAVLERGDLLVSERAAALELETENASFERARRLLEQKIIADEDFEQTRMRRNAAEEGLDRIRYELSKCFLRAPFEGVVSGRFVEKGQFVRWDDGVVLYQVTALRPLLARVYVPEWALFALRQGQAARIVTTASAPGGSQGRAGRTGELGAGARASGPQHFAGSAASDGIPARIKWINNVVDAASATAEVLVEVIEGQQASQLRPGLSVEVSFALTLGGPGGGTITLPLTAFEPDAAQEGESAVLRVLGDDGTVKPRTIIVGIVGDDRVEIREGLAAGDRVVLPE